MKNVPPIKRARGYRLYDYSGRRYLDLWQNDGSAILGHRFDHLNRELKSVLSKGLLSDLPSIYSRRLGREILRRYPVFDGVQICPSLDHAIRIISRFLGRPFSESEICDPAKGEWGSVSYDRPFLGIKTVGLHCGQSPTEDTGSAKAKVLLPMVPFRIGSSPVILCLRGGMPVPPNEAAVVSPFILAGVLSSLSRLRRFVPPPWFSEPLIGDQNRWVQRGPYILPCFEPALYPRVFEGFLSEGILLSPSFEKPSILPAEASEGELKKIVRLFSVFPKR
jgi:hypothetical protein